MDRASDRPNEPTAAYVGQLAGAVSVLLLSMALVLISSLPLVEEWFDGIDRAAIWHRRMAITGLLLLIVHIPISRSRIHTFLGGPLGAIGAIGMISLAVWAVLPRWQSVLPHPLRAPIEALKDNETVRKFLKIFGGYDLWRQVHRLTGLFVAAAFFHGLLDGSPFPKSSLLRWSYVAIGGIGLAFYVYRELLSRFFSSLHDYEVHEVTPVGRGPGRDQPSPHRSPVALRSRPVRPDLHRGQGRLAPPPLHHRQRAHGADCSA